MSKKAYVGVNGIARNVKNIYVGVNGVARKVVKGYVGVNGVAQQFWATSSSTFVARVKLSASNESEKNFTVRVNLYVSNN